MQIKLMEILVHPDFYQMSVPNLPLHERQLALREKWEQRIDVLKNQQDAILLYFSYMTTGSLKQGLKNLSTISNKIEREEVERIQRCMEKLGNRFILFGWLEIPDSEDLARIFSSRNFTYIPNETKICGYGEIFEVCVEAWVYKTALSLNIPKVEYCREASLTNSDCVEIDKTRMDRMVSSFMTG